jgi:DNA (cytosine-5)-methyltransferase 1
MSEFIEKAENVLTDLAKDYVPLGTRVEAVIHQWLHAIASSSELFATDRGLNKKRVVNILKKFSLYDSIAGFRSTLYGTIHFKPLVNHSFRFIDLFAGVGGMRQGFESAGGICVFSSEFEKNAQSTYRQNYGELPFGDIINVAPGDIPEHDVLIAGFPCQPFSHAGLKLGIDDTRGTLFYNIAKILEQKQPKFAVLENVKGLISHDKGHTLKIILQTLIDIGYKCSIDEKIIKAGDNHLIQAAAKHMVLKSKDFGVPQNRQRIYIVLWHESSGEPFEYPEPPMPPVKVSDILENHPEKKYTISDRLWRGHKKRKADNKKNGKGFGYGLVTAESEYTNTISARYYKDGSEVLISQDGKNPRKLTPREAARLQGFPEDFIINSSDVQAYKQFGNSVSIPVVKAIAGKILEVL